MLRLIPRHSPSAWHSLLAPVLALLATVATGAIIFAVLGYAPAEALYHFFISPFSRADRIADLFVKACPLIIIALGLIFCYRANVWNIGAEGQFIIGALAAGIFALTMPPLEGVPLVGGITLFAMMLIAIIAGAIWAGVVAVLKVHFQANEILVSLMLSYVASLLLDYMVRSPLRDPLSLGFPLSKIYPDGALIGLMPLPGLGQIGQLHYGVLIAFVLIPVVWFVLSRSLLGFRLTAQGLAPKASHFAGFRSSITVYCVLAISGGCAGLAGMIEVSANIGQLQPNISFGYGFTAIIVAFLARLNPLATILAGLVIAMAELGADNAQIALGIPKVVSGLFKGILLFYLLAGASFQQYTIEWRRQ